MGVPKFFRYISERYPCLSELVRENQVPDFDNLYLDMNGIIHNCSHPNDDDVHFRITEEQIFKDIFFYLEVLFNMIKPQKLFFLAVDGVAPRAKMNQQRSRRFRSAKEAELQEEKARSKGEVLPKEARFDSNCITPGTPFMCRLNDALRYFIQQKISTSKHWRHCQVILSGHETPGEGEHKIMEYIRYLKASEGYDPNTRHCLYGLDADLVMLGLCTHERHFSLLREEVKFGKKNNRPVSVSAQRFFLLHLSLLREYLEQEFIVLKDEMKIPFDIEKIIDDWVLMGFLVGNDFIPNIPNLHINTNALPMLYNAYISAMPKLDGYINEGGHLNLSRLQIYIEGLSNFDRDYFSAHYEDLKFLESKHQFDGRNDETFGGNQALMDLVKATEFEFDSSPEDEDEDDEDFDADRDFEKEFHQHRRDYYVNKMKYEEMTPEVLAEQAHCYIEALQWTLSYYYHGVQSWNWYYPHHYAPFISDLKNFKNFKINFEMSRPFLPFQQLMSVLPAGSRDHVPVAYKKLMTSPDSPVIDFYPQNFETDLNGKKQEWEAVVLIPFIEEKRLLKALDALEKELSADEVARNVHGPMYAYTYSNKSRGQLEGPLNFPSIGNLMCNEQQIYRKDVEVAKHKLVLGPSKGAMKNVYFTGFPTFKHIEFHSELRRQGVSVFQQPSREDNMIIVVNETVNEKTLEQVGNELLNQFIFVSWPHLMEARVVRISDANQSYNGTYDKTDPQKWRMETQAIRDHHHSRMGIDVGEIKFIIHVQQVTGEEFIYNQKTKSFKLMKTYEKQEICYPYQCIVPNVKAYRKHFKEELPFTEAFKKETEVFMLSNPYYGSHGVVTDVNCYEKSGRIKVCFTVPQEPDFEAAEVHHDKCSGSYMSAYQAATLIGISDHAFNRITGSVFIMSGQKREISFQEASKVNIGLQLKFPKQNEEVAGYTKKDRIWLYSEKAVAVVQQYYCKYPVVFEVLAKRTGMNENFFESDLFTETAGEESLSGLNKFIAQLPSQKAPRIQIGSESLDKEVIDIVKKEIEKVKEAPMKKITMQVKPHLLYAPKLSVGTSKPPDTHADYQVLDRVVLAKDTENYSVGMKGTVIRMARVKDLNPVRQECLNKEDVYCEVIFDVNHEIARFHIEKLINLSYGKNKDPTAKAQTETKVVEKVEPKLAPLTESFSSILQRQTGSKVEDKKKNFANVWNQLKTGGDVVPTQKEKSKEPSPPESSKNSDRHPTVPSIIAPSSLPKPPEEWLKSVNTETQKPKVESQESSAMKFIQNFQQLNVSNGNAPTFQQQPMIMNGNHPQHFMGNPNFSRPLKQQQQQPQQNNGQFFKNNTPQQQQHQQRFFHNNQNHHQNGNRMRQQNDFQNKQKQFPMNVQPILMANAMPIPIPMPPMMMMIPPQQVRQPQPMMQPMIQQQQNVTQTGNPFVPLQASRKATKSKNSENVKKPNTNQPKASSPPIANEMKKVQDKPQKPTDNTVNAPKPTKSAPIDNRKSRLAINFSAN